MIQENGTEAREEYQVYLKVQNLFKECENETLVLGVTSRSMIAINGLASPGLVVRCCEWDITRVGYVNIYQLSPAAFLSPHLIR